MEPTRINPGRQAAQGLVVHWALVAAGTGETTPVADSIIVGRRSDCALSIPDEFVSGNHARLFIENGTLIVEDLGSSNGTWVNGERITRQALKQGDEVRFDRHEYRVHRVPVAAAAERAPDPVSGPVSNPAPTPESEPASAQVQEPPAPVPDPVPNAAPRSPAPAVPAPAPEPAPPPPARDESADAPESGEWWRRSSKGIKGTVIGAFDKHRDGMQPRDLSGLPGDVSVPTLIGVSGPVEGRRIELQPGMMMVGRNPGCDVTIDEETVSDKHAQLIHEAQGSVRLINLPNTGGILVNGARIHGSAYLNARDTISFGPRVEFIFLSPVVERPAQPETAVERGVNRNYLIAAGLVACVLLLALLFYVF